MKRFLITLVISILSLGGVAYACVPKTVDVCKNIDGNQETIPQGYHKDNPDDEDCVADVVVVPPPETPPVVVTDNPTPPPAAQVVIPESPPATFAGK